jgi:hypothetical protein
MTMRVEKRIIARKVGKSRRKRNSGDTGRRTIGGGETKRADDGARVDLFEVLRDAVATTARRGLERALL